MVRNKNRIIFGIVCMSLLCLCGLVCASAESTPITPALNRSDLFSMAEGVEDQLDLQKPLAVSSYYPIAITNTSVADQDYRYYVYATGAPNVWVSEVYGDYDIVLTSMAAVYRFEYDMQGNGLHSPEFIALHNGFDLTLDGSELLAMYLLELGGWTYGDSTAVGTQPDSWEGLAYDKWRDAMAGYQGVWNGTTVNDRIAEARQEGFDNGVITGKEEGYAKAKSYYEGIMDRIEDDAYQNGWDEATEKFKNTNVVTYWLDIGRIITSYTDGVANIFQSLTDFELFGINIAGVFGAIIATLVLGFVVSLLLKLFGLLV